MNKDMIFGSAIRPCLFVLIFLASLKANAVVTYQYVGNNYTNFFPTSGSMYDTSMRVSGNFTVDSKLISVSDDITSQVLSYSFTDGVTTYSDTDPNGKSQFLINTDSNGHIINWIVDIFDIDPLSETLQAGDVFFRIISRNESDETYVAGCDFVVNGDCIGSIFDGASVHNDPGSWSVVPVPPAIWLFGSGLLGMIGLSRRKKAAP